MTVVLRHHDKLEVNRVEYQGSVSLAELTALAEFQAEDPQWLNFDCLSLVMPGADFHSVSFAALDALFARYWTLFKPIHFLILRRSVWLCQSPPAEAHVNYWLGGRDTKAGMSSDVRLFATFKEAGAWLVLNSAQISMLESGAGFSDIARFTNPEVSRAAGF